MGLRWIAAVMASTTLASCATVPDLGPKPTMRPATSIAAAQSLAPAEGNWPMAQWWTIYGDTQLDALIDEGLKDSPDVVVAAARFRQAQGYAEQTGAAALPRVNAQARANLMKQSYNEGIPAAFVPHGWQDTGQAALSLSFDLDLWGRNRAALAAATSERDAARIEMNQARLMLTTAIASTYADLARLYAERDVQQSALDVRIATQKLVADRVQSGLDTRGELRQADAGIPTARVDLNATDEAIVLARHQIAALIGAGPDRGNMIVRPAPSMLAPRALPVDVTTNLVGRRPDVAAARARAEAAASRIKVARADFYPAISLSGLIGLQALGLENVARSGSSYGNVGPAISLPIFHGGALRGQYRGARGTYDEAVANYDKTVLTAYREVADAVSSQQMLGTRLGDARLALDASEEAYSIATKRYHGGLSTYLEVLTAEERLLQARRLMADLNARAFMLDISLVRALGGGFATSSTSTSKDMPNG